VIRTKWPDILAEEKVLNPAARRAQAMRNLARRLETNPPQGFVIAAGSTGFTEPLFGAFCSVCVAAAS